MKPSRDSNVLDISYTAVDPKFAAIVANAFAKAYIDTNLAMRVEPARQYATWFDGQIKTLRDNLEKAQTNLSAFQRKTGIVATDERIDIENARLAELSSQLVALQGQSADSRSRQNQARDSIETMPEVLSHPLVQGLKADVARLEAKLQDTRAQLGKNHPGVERAEAELRSMREKLDVEMKKVITGITTANQVNQEREVEIRRSLNAQRARVMAMKAYRDEQAVLMREVESAQRAYDAVSNRLTQTNLESRTSQTNVYLLNPAVEPNIHSRPRIVLNVDGLGRRGFDAGPRAGPGERAPRSARSVRAGSGGGAGGARPRQHRSGRARAGRPPQAVRPQAAAASVAGVGTSTLPMNDRTRPRDSEAEGVRALIPDTRRPDRSLGAILIDAGRLTVEDAARVLQAQKRWGLRFGEAAVKLGLITQEDIRFALSRQFDFPYLHPSGGQLSDEIVAAYRPFSKQAESVRALRSQLLLRWLGDEPERRCVALVSAGRGEGRTRLAANLAVVFSQLGARTLLIDGDLRHPRVHGLFNLANTRGLSSALADRGEPTVHRIPSLLSLNVVTSGPIPPNPQELLSRPAFVRLLDEQRDKFDVIILDSPASDQSADAYLLAARAGAAVVLARRHTTRVPKLQQLADRLAAARATVIGAVFNDF